MDEKQYVGFWARFLASIIDISILIMILYPLFYVIYGDDFILRSSTFTLLNMLLNYIFPFIVVLIFWYYKSATPGKLWLNATIVDIHTLGKPSMKQYIVRNLGYFISLLPFGLGYFWAGWDSKKQTWHDKLEDTVVIQPKKNLKL